MCVKARLHRRRQSQFYAREDRFGERRGTGLGQPALQRKPTLEGPIVHQGENGWLCGIEGGDHRVDDRRVVVAIAAVSEARPLPKKGCGGVDMEIPLPPFGASRILAHSPLTSCSSDQISAVKLPWTCCFRYAHYLKPPELAVAMIELFCFPGNTRTTPHSRIATGACFS